MPAVQYSDQLATRIATLIVEGKTIPEISSLPGMPAKSTILAWVSKGDAGREKYRRFAALYSRARAARADLLDAELQDITRRMLAPRMIPGVYDNGVPIVDENGEQKMVPNPDWLDANAGRAAADVIKWRAARMNPKKFGEHKHIDVETTGTVTHTIDAAPDWLRAAAAKTIDGKAQPIRDPAAHKAKEKALPA